MPVCATPARSSERIVAATPALPRSRAWFEAVLHASQPVAAIASASAGGALNRGDPAGGAMSVIAVSA